MINPSRLSKHPKNAAFVAAFEEITVEHPFMHMLRLMPDLLVTFELTDGFKDGEMRLGAIQSLDQGKGNASKALDIFLALADKHDITITLDIDPFGEGGLGKRALRTWYKSRGFKIDKYGEGRR